MKSKKIIWLVPSIKNTLEESYKKSLEKCNIFIDLYCYRNKIIEKGYKGFIYDLKKTCRNSDLVLFTLWSGSHLLSPKLMKDIKKNSKVVLMAVDDEIYSTSQSIYYANSVDLIVTTDFFGKGLYEQIGIKTIYFPFPRYDLPCANLKDSKLIDVSFIGNIHTADRKKYINFLTRNGIDIQVYGLGSKNGEINREEYISIIKNSKINLNFTKVSLSKSLLNKEPWRLDSRQLKGRPFEIFALGSFCLSEWAPHARFLFDEDKHMPIFHDEESLLYKINYFLENEFLRKKIAIQANSHYSLNYSYPNSLINLFKQISEKLDNDKIKDNHKLIMPPVDYLERVNISTLQLSRNIFNRGELVKALKLGFYALNFKVLIYSILKLPSEIYKFFIFSKSKK